MIILKSNIRNFKSLCHLVRSTDSFKINRGHLAKNSQKEIAISRSNLKLNKNQKKSYLGINARIPHAKNQLPTTTIVTCRENTDKQTNKQTNKQTEIENTEGPIDFFGQFFFLISLSISGPKIEVIRSKYKNSHLQNRKWLCVFCGFLMVKISL